MAARKELCRYCEPLWNLKEVTLDLIPIPKEDHIESSIDYQVNMTWIACLDELKCAPLSRTPKSELRLTNFVPSVISEISGEITLRLNSPPRRFYGKTYSSGKISKKRICCRKDPGGLSSDPATCCDTKRDLICKYEGSYIIPGTDVATPVDECCMKGSVKGVMKIRGLVVPPINSFQTNAIAVYVNNRKTLLQEVIEGKLAEQAGGDIRFGSAFGSDRGDVRKFMDRCACTTTTIGPLQFGLIFTDHTCPKIG